MENTLAISINSKFMPLLEDLRRAKNLEKVHETLDIRAAYIQNFSNDLTGGKDLIAPLSTTELRVASMIKNGIVSQDIANRLHISLHTVKTHRRSIRKKLRIKNSQINLASYLRSIMW